MKCEVFVSLHCCAVGPGGTHRLTWYMMTLTFDLLLISELHYLRHPRVCNHRTHLQFQKFIRYPQWV